MIAGAGRRRTALRGDAKKQVAISEFAFSEACARMVRTQCASQDFELIPFHAQGVGDRIMEEMIGDGAFDAVIDLVPAGLSEAMSGGQPRRASTGSTWSGPGDSRNTHAVRVRRAEACGPYTRRLSDPLWREKEIEKRKLYVQDEMRVQPRRDQGARWKRSRACSPKS